MKTIRELFKTRPHALGFSIILVFFFSVAWADDTDLDRISHDPYTDPLAQHATEVEPLLVANGDTIVTSLQAGRFFGTGSDNIGWATSKDGGKTWIRPMPGKLGLFHSRQAALRWSVIA